MGNGIIVEFRTPSSSGAWNLLSAENLQVMGKRPEDMIAVTYSDFFPGKPYWEKDVAWSAYHPVIGSGSACANFSDGTTGYIDDIFYQDSGPGGRPHWNHERRYFLSTWEGPKVSKDIENHAIDKSPWIEIFTDVPGQAKKQVRCYWVE